MSVDDAAAMLDRAQIIEGLGDLGLVLGAVHRHDSRSRSWCVAVGRPGGRRLVHVGEHRYLAEAYDGVTIFKGYNNVCGFGAQGGSQSTVSLTLAFIFAAVHGADFEQLCQTLGAKR